MKLRRAQRYDEDDVRAARGSRWGERHNNGDEDRNARRTKIEALPAWARAIEEMDWAAPGPALQERGGL